MATVSISFNCGCGFHTNTEKEAAAHSDTCYHNLTVSGYVKPSGERPPKVKLVSKSSLRRRVKAELPEVKVEAESPVKSFDDLRKRLQGRHKEG